MIKWVYNGNIFDSKCDLIVVPVNCVGVMGAGLAKQVKELHPTVFDMYKRACKNGSIKPGRALGMFASEGTDGQLRAFLMFTTKNDWRDPSKLEWIETGLQDVKLLLETGTVAIPPVGCGLGGLEWNDVKQLLERHLSDTKMMAEVYCPHAPIRFPVSKR